MTIKIEMLKKLKVQKCLDNNQLLDNKKKIAKDWFANLRDEICASFEKIENNKSTNNKNINFNSSNYYLTDKILYEENKISKIKGISFIYVRTLIALIAFFTPTMFM